MRAVTPTVSVVIVAHNSREDLEQCLASLQGETEVLEIIVIDNASTDGVAGWLASAYPHVRRIAAGENRGYGAGNNLGIEAAAGRYVFVLNPDTVVHAGAVGELVRVVGAHPRAFVNPKLLQEDGSLNTCGNEMHYTGITTCPDVGADPAGYSGILHPFLLSGAAILAEREAWLAVGGFDERFFMYMEDTDLSLRARLQGYEILCAADALVTHRYRLKMSAGKFYYLERNRLLTLLKSFESSTLRHALPGLLLTELATWAYAAIRGPAYLSARLRGYSWLWATRREIASSRRHIQRSRQIPDTTLSPRMLAALPFDQLLPAHRLASWLARATTPMYRLAQPHGRWAS